MDRPRLNVSDLREEELDAYFRFRERIFPAGPKRLDRRRWDWWFRDNPQVEDRRILTRVVREDDKIVGCITPVPLRLKVGSRTVRSAWWNDFFMDEGPALGLAALRLAKSYQDEFEINIHANLSPAAHRLFSRMGFVDHTANVRAVGAWLPTDQSKRPLRSRIRAGYRDAALGLLGGSGIDVESSGTLPPEADELWESVASGLRISLVKDREYLSWRYQECPSWDFRFLTAYRRGRIQGLAVVTRSGPPDSGAGRGEIVDLVIRPDDRATCCRLLSASLDHFAAEDCRSCTAHISNPVLVRLCQKLGFYVERSDLGLMVRGAQRPDSAAAIGPELADPAAWSFQVGDSDRF